MDSLSKGWVVPTSEKARYFIIASVVMIGQVVGLLFLGIWLSQRVDGFSDMVGAAIGGTIGLITGTLSLYKMALSFEKNVLTRLGKQQCPRCKQSCDIGEIKCPTCELEFEPLTSS